MGKEGERTCQEKAEPVPVPQPQAPIGHRSIAGWDVRFCHCWVEGGVARTVVVAVRAITGEMAAAKIGRRVVSILSDVLAVLAFQTRD